MGNLTITIIIAALLLGLAVIFLGIGYLITGKSRLRRGTCGSVPQEKGKKKKNCSICGAENPCEKEEKKK